MEIKFNCSNSTCRRRIAVDESLAGKLFSCPACGVDQQVPASKNIKFNCSNPDCEQHIVVDVSESGRYLKCPSCSKALQVPGPLPKAIASMPVRHAEVAKPPTSQVRFTCRWMRLVYGWGAGAALFGLIVGGYYVSARSKMPKQLAAISNEIFATGRIWDAPLESNDGSLLLYAQDMQDGAGIFLVDLATLKRTQINWMKSADIEGVKRVKLFGWSPDDHYIAVSVQATNSALNRMVQNIFVCDGQNGQVRDSLMNSNSTITEAVWLTTNTLVMENRSHRLMLWNLEADKSLGKAGKKGVVKSLQLENKGSYALVRVSGRAVAFIDKGNVNTFDIPTGRAEQLTHFTDTKLEWLDYNPNSGKYLFCVVHGDDVTNRFVYEFLPNARNDTGLVQRNFTYSFKGQWINSGDDVAYVTTTGDKTYLAIDAHDVSMRTNVFAGGSVRSYGVAPKRDKIYAVAALRYKTQSIWEYDIAKKTFRDVLPLDQRVNSVSKIIQPVMASVTNQGNETVDYYYVPPVNVIANKKYPVVIDLYPVNRYDQNVQMFVNAGIFYVAANRFGLNDWQAVAKPENILAIYAQILKDPNIDPRRIYIYGRSFSTVRVAEMVNDHPEYWRGAILFSPVTFPEVSKSALGHPHIFIAEGDEDERSLQNGCAQLWLNVSRRLVPARIHMEHTGHGFGTQNYKTAYDPLIKFILADN